MCHRADHATTVWGGDDLVAMLNAISFRATNREAELWRIVEFMRQVKRLRYADYYTCLTNDAHAPKDGKPCQWQPVRGIKFDVNDRPRGGYFVSPGDSDGSFADPAAWDDRAGGIEHHLSNFLDYCFL